MEDISLHILDVAENSVAAGATEIKIKIIDDSRRDLFSLEIEDNGKGIPEKNIKNVLDPFHTSRTTRNVGFGLPLLAQSAKETGGDMSIKSIENSGTVVSAHFKKSHIDMKPLGNIVDSLIALILGNPDIDYFFSYKNNDNDFFLDTGQIKSDLDGIPINTPSVISTIRDFLNKSLSDIKK